MRKLIAIIGPTASGKTEISLELAGKIDLEVVSVDSRQIYRYMDIGTAKPTESQRKAVRHHMIDIVNPDQDYSAGRYSQEARDTIREIESRGKLPLLVGGSGLYLRALVDGLFDLNARDPELRHSLKLQAQVVGLEALHRKLSEVDPETASRVHPNDFHRISRALEVYYLTGKPISDIRRTYRSGRVDADVLMIGLMVDRELLYRRIGDRVDRMVSDGLVEEVEALLDMGYDPNLNSLRTVGYREIIDYLYGRCSLFEAIDRIKLNTRRYAKRQMTWFRKDERIRWVESRDEVFKLVDVFLG